MSTKVFRTVKELREWKHSLPKASKLGFVPTMGALHAGHISLVSASLTENEYTVVSIFVNPSQFAPHEDLDSYPRTFDADYAKLGEISIKGHGVDAIFAPTVNEMYPSGITLQVEDQKGAFISVLGVSEQLEGKTRPNFFRGVATVVTKLFNAVGPDRAYFGQKDIQQTIVLKRMVKDLLMPVDIVVLPIVREECGLAMSSRNSYLSDELREKSSLIFKALSEGQEQYLKGGKRQEIIDAVLAVLKDDSFKVDYVSVAHPTELKELEVIDRTLGAILSIAVYVTENERTTRLIDNVIL
jgi:pantoate--beta-alanine ligase